MKPQEIVDVIENILESKKISKGEFYRACGINASVFSNWRRNENYPSMANLDSINRFLGVNFGIALLDEIEKTAADKDSGLEEKERALLEAFMVLPADKQDRVIQTLQDAARGLKALDVFG